MKSQQFLIAALALLFSSNLVSGQVFRAGLCPKRITTVQDFDANPYLGTWYEYARYPFAFEAGGRCTQAQYGLLENGEVSVVNTQIDFNNKPKSIDGQAKIVGSGKLLVQFNGFAALAGGADYWILDTDYTTYAVVYSCQNLIFAHSQVIWILTRDRYPSKDTVEKAKQGILKQKLSLKELSVSDQKGCQNIHQKM